MASVADVSADWRVTRDLGLGFYYAYSKGKSVVAAIYPTDRNAQFGFVELNYHWGLEQKATAK